jgi:nitrogen-specific signal transduction histidine kinase
MDNKKTPQLPNDDLDRLAHDLRNVMSAIYSYAQILELSLTSLQLEKEMKIANKITNEIRKVNSMISKRMIEAPQSSKDDT